MGRVVVPVRSVVPGPCTDQVRFKVRDHGEDVEEKPADGIGGS